MSVQAEVAPPRAAIGAATLAGHRHRIALGGVASGIGPPGGLGGDRDTSAALTHVQAHGATSRFALVVSSEEEAAQYVVNGETVASMGGFTGRETVLDRAYLPRLVRNREARYFLIDGVGPGGVNAAATTISSACTLVPSQAWGSSGGSLCDCAGKSAALAG